MKKALRIALPVIVLLILGGTALCLWLSPEKPAPGPGAACPPVRTALAVLALAENPTARTYAAPGTGAAAFTNVFAHAGLVCETNACADLVFVSGACSRKSLAQAWARCSTNGILAVHFNVRKKTFAAFRAELEALPAGEWRMWFPGRSDCLVTMGGGESGRRRNAVPTGNESGRRWNAVPTGNESGAARVRLADLLDLFSREGIFADLAHAGIDSLPVLFASYVGSRATVMPAFDFARGEVVPECFVTKDVPATDWFDTAGVDADIREPLLSEIRSMQVVRRMVLQGDMHARAGKMEAAMDVWTKSIRRNPNDSLILERICLLDVNAETFLKVGNFPMAAQCLETMVCLRPKDVPTLRRLVRVLRQTGKKTQAAAVAKRADELVKAKLKK